MEIAYVKKFKEQAICCWDAPDRDAIEAVFEKAGLVTESVEEVEIYHGR